MAISCKENCGAERVPLCRNIAGTYWELQGGSQWPVFSFLCGWLVGTAILCFFPLEFATLKFPATSWPISCSLLSGQIAHSPSSLSCFYNVIILKQRNLERINIFLKVLQGRYLSFNTNIPCSHTPRARAHTHRHTDTDTHTHTHTHTPSSYSSECLLVLFWEFTALGLGIWLIWLTVIKRSPLVLFPSFSSKWSLFAVITLESKINMVLFGVSLISNETVPSAPDGF